MKILKFDITKWLSSRLTQMQFAILLTLATWAALGIFVAILYKMARG